MPTFWAKAKKIDAEVSEEVKRRRSTATGVGARLSRIPPWPSSQAFLPFAIRSLSALKKSFNVVPLRSQKVDGFL